MAQGWAFTVCVWGGGSGGRRGREGGGASVRWGGLCAGERPKKGRARPRLGALQGALCVWRCVGSASIHEDRQPPCPDVCARHALNFDSLAPLLAAQVLMQRAAFNLASVTDTTQAAAAAQAASASVDPNFLAQLLLLQGGNMLSNGNGN